MRSPLRDLADIYYGKSPSEVIVDDSDIPVFGTGGAYARSSRALFHGPAVVVPRKGSLGNPQLILGPFWAADTTYVVLPKSKVDIKWLYYCLDAYDLRKLNEATGVPSINRDWLYRIIFYAPSFAEQGKIAEMLMTVDSAIEQTEALIVKYQQIKAGFARDLFTRGVLSDGRLRPTYAEAPQHYKDSTIGLIPKDWEAAYLSEYLDPICGIKPGPFGSSLTKDGYTSSGYRIYGQEQVIAGSLEIGDYYISAAKFTEMRGFEVLSGDVLLSLVGTVGCVLVVESPFEPGIINPRLIRLRPLRGFASSQFLKSLLLTSGIHRQIDSLAGGGTMPVINGKVIRRLMVPLIKLPEQKLIEIRLNVIDKYIESMDRELKKLILEKQGLMQDLLTGRVSVNVEKNSKN